MDWWTPYIGLRFGTGTGEVTCWSLVRRAYADRLGVELPEHGDTSPADLVRVARLLRDGKDSETWCEPARPGVLDVVLMRSARGGRAICHVGLIADAAQVLHAEEDTGSVIVPISHFTIRNRIAGFRRYAPPMMVPA